MRAGTKTFEGVPCRRGGHTRRYRATGACVSCHNAPRLAQGLPEAGLRRRPCIYCGSPGPSQLDVRVHERGLVAGNILPVCGRCHVARGPMDHDEFIGWIIGVYEKLTGQR